MDVRIATIRCFYHDICSHRYGKRVSSQFFLKKTIIYDAYAKADHVVCVSIGIEKKIVSLVPSAKTIVMNVLLNEKEIQKRASTTKDLMIPPRLNDAFDSNQVTVFISVGRYSK